MRVCKILAFSICEWQLCHCNWWPEIQKSQFLPPPPSSQKLQTFTFFSCHRFSEKFSLPDQRARFHRFPGYLLRILFIGLIIWGTDNGTERPDGQSWMLTALGKIEKWFFSAPAMQATICLKSLLLRVPSCDSHAVCSFVIDPIIVSPVVKMRPHPAAHPHKPLIRKYPPPLPSPDTGVGQVNHSEILGGQEDCVFFFFKKIIPNIYNACGEN